MSEAETKHTPGEPAPRKSTVNLSPKQLGVGGVSIIAAIYMLEPLRDFVRHETAPQVSAIAEIKAEQKAMKADFTAALNEAKADLSNEIKANADRVITELRLSEARSNDTDKRQDTERQEDRREVADLRNMFLNKRLRTSNN